jgi:hypothetical protein
MLDFPAKSNPNNVHDSANDDSRSREGDLASDAVGLPLLIDEPAPLSDALHIPTLINEKPESKPSAAPTNVPQPINAPTRGDGEFDKFGRNRAPRQNAEPQNSNRATTPAGPPRHDAGTLIGVPSNHPQTEASDKLAKLDKVALALGAVIVIGPLAAAMLGRMGL